jgi:hypothetical protein
MLKIGFYDKKKLKYKKTTKPYIKNPLRVKFLTSLIKFQEKKNFCRFGPKMTQGVYLTSLQNVESLCSIFRNNIKIR